MRQVQTNAELREAHLSGDGFIFNFFTSGPTGAQYNVLHEAQCGWVRRMMAGKPPSDRPSVRKVFFPRADEAQSWLAANLGSEGMGWKQCDTCRPCRAAASVLATVPSDAQVEAGPGPDVRSATQGVPASLGPWSRGAPFAKPSSPPLRLPASPRLASWNKTGDPDQERLARYLDAADELLRQHYERLTGPLALRLDVGLPQGAGLLDQRDLDNYLLPLAARVSRSVGAGLACVWGTKQIAPESYVRIEQAIPVSAAPSSDCSYTVRTSASAQSTAFKEQIRAQLAAASQLSPGPVQLQLCFTVSPRRNWLNLWKPAIDALGQFLGHAPGGRPWSPLDGRVTDLGLHCQLDPAMGNDVLITIASSCIRV